MNGDKIKTPKQINYFDNTYFAETKIKAGTREDTSEPFIEYLHKHPPSQVLLKGSHDFCFSESARRFWEVVGAGVPVFSDNLNSSIGQAQESLPAGFLPSVNIDLYTPARERGGEAFTTAAYFGYGYEIQRYLSTQFVEFFQSKPKPPSDSSKVREV